MMHCTAYLFTLLYSGTLEAGKLLILPLAAKMKVASGWNIKERCALPPGKEADPGRARVWIHAASAGESKLLVKFLGLLRKKHPMDEYVLTAATRTGVDYLRTCESDDIAAVGFFPLDTIGLMKEMLRAYKVSRVWLMETELWPSMMLACMQCGVPVGIVNARVEEKSFSSYRLLAFMYKPIFEYLDVVLAQNEVYASRFKNLGVRPNALHVMGNLKSIVVIGPLSPERRQALRDSLMIGKNDIVLTAGCVHTGEGTILREALEIVRDGNIRLKCIAVPRHLSETGQLLKELGPKTFRFYEAAASSPWEVCIIDKMGILEDMYAISSVSFIGGTFVAVGGHNVWDAAQFGVPVLLGPDCHTQQESCNQLLSAGVGFQAASPDELARNIIAILKKNNGRISSSLSALVNLSRNRIERMEELIP